MIDTYEIHFRRNYDTPNDFVVVGKHWFFTSLEEAREAREVSGDLVVHRRTGRVVDNPAWLWNWERDRLDCYAQRAMRHDNPKENL